MTDNSTAEKIHTLAVLPLKGIPVFPESIIHFDVARVNSVNAVNYALENGQFVFLLAQKNLNTDTPTEIDFYTIGTIARIKQVLTLDNGNVKILLEGIVRGKLLHINKYAPFIEGDVKETRIINNLPESDDKDEKFYMRKLKEELQNYYKIKSHYPSEVQKVFGNINTPGNLSDAVASSVNFAPEIKQKLLEEYDPLKRVMMLISLLKDEIKYFRITSDMDKKLQPFDFETYKKETFKSMLKRIEQRENGEIEEADDDENDCIGRLLKRGVPAPVLDKVAEEENKLTKIPPSSSEYTVLQNYLEWLESIPWEVKSSQSFELENARPILDKDHWGMDKVKDRIIEFLAVRKLTEGKKSPVICLVGPPGVGKTSIAKSIAKVLGREYVRISLGGVHDESEIRGHRRTYIGSMPGRIVSALKYAGTMNPVILLDEIDKLGDGIKGAPSAALLEVLDTEQNFSFRDNYLELETDLSDVFFITTANTLDTIERPLLDRMEIIELSSYTSEDKKAIAEMHLIPKQLSEHGLKKSNLTIKSDAVDTIISAYTREAGVRELERKIAQIMRHAAKLIALDGKKRLTVSSANIEKYLGKKIFPELCTHKEANVGVVNGLAWTQFGGDTLSIEVNVMDGSGNLELTGQLGDVMKESAKAAITYVRANASMFGVPEDFSSKCDIHIHVPEGAVPKDGPSAGITMCTGIISALTGKKVRGDVAMTGEITITGRILPIGGLKEKAMAAYREGIKTVLIPKENVADISELPDNVRSSLDFVVADSMKTVTHTAFIN